MKITSINLSKINKAVTGITETVRRSKVIIDGISEKVNKSNESLSFSSLTSVSLISSQVSASSKLIYWYPLNKPSRS